MSLPSPRAVEKTALQSRTTDVSALDTSDLQSRIREEEVSLKELDEKRADVDKMFNLKKVPAAVSSPLQAPRIVANAFVELM